jgi:hypothetical protein
VISAKLLVKAAFICMGIAMVAAGLVALGVDQFRPVVFVAVLSGAFTVAVWLIGVMTGKLKNDLRE